ncbi:hypothetical protein FDUTEX481_01197 [Tolypothrix sp. PCC 7601]|nr:hypothetical protein FDUTEX481_01197 [Tolypothrix sp. PCC 7601]
MNVAPQNENVLVPNKNFALPSLNVAEKSKGHNIVVPPAWYIYLQNGVFLNLDHT